MESDYTAVPACTESQVDWLSCTSRDGGDDAPLWLLGTTLARDEEANGNRARQASRLGYLGCRVRRAFVGLGPQGTLVELSGDLAARAFDEATAACDHVARLDVAATVQFPDERLDLERQLWEQYLAHSATVGGVHRGRYVEDDERGATCYVGSPKSDVLMRIYNKGIESRRQGTPEEAEHYRNCHRYELQLRNARACAMAALLSDPGNRAPAIQAQLAGYLVSRGISPTDLSESPMRLVPGFRRRSDDETSLGWLSGQVRPTLERLASRRLGPDALAALGLGKLDPNRISSQNLGPKGGIYRAPRL